MGPSHSNTRNNQQEEERIIYTERNGQRVPFRANFAQRLMIEAFRHNINRRTPVFNNEVHQYQLPPAPISQPHTKLEKDATILTDSIKVVNNDLYQYQFTCKVHSYQPFVIAIWLDARLHKNGSIQGQSKPFHVLNVSEGEQTIHVGPLPLKSPKTNIILDIVPSNPRQVIAEKLLLHPHLTLGELVVFKQLLVVKHANQQFVYEILNLFGDEEEMCVICMCNKKDTMILPCRHYILCSECANILRTNNDVCPLCREHIESFLHFDFSMPQPCQESASNSITQTV
eukprot:TRINITY_DN13754_c0_g1_i1.p1 TRINITY_DN13754_c0_g1~~TRINITY_DN13754_c0_g1_i1.p1  ORF type:complete len:285 (+),score=62.68 TRINITY_DN13754_c0_g1_i1:30-884(+)